MNISANKKSSRLVKKKKNHKSSSATTQQTPGALGDQVLYPATVASPWPDESRDADEDYVPDYEAEDFDYDDEPLSGGSSLMVTPTKEATGGNRRNGSFYESATTTPNAEKVRDEPRPFGSVNAVAATTSIASTSSPTEEKKRIRPSTSIRSTRIRRGVLRGQKIRRASLQSVFKLELGRKQQD